MGENRCHAKFSLNSINNLNYKETSPEFIAGKLKKEKKKKIILKFILVKKCVTNFF
jgi:hypothetical protein